MLKLQLQLQIDLFKKLLKKRGRTRKNIDRTQQGKRGGRILKKLFLILINFTLKIF